jgi:hypothetical protein
MTTPTWIDLGNPGRVYIWHERDSAAKNEHLLLMSRNSYGPARFPSNSLLKDVADLQVRQSWPWWSTVADGFARGLNPTFLWPTTGTPQLIEIGQLLWFCPPSSTCQPVRMLQPISLAAASETRPARVDQLLGQLATVLTSSPPAPSTGDDVRASLWIGMPAGSTVPVALYSPDLTASAYQVFAIDTAVTGPFSQGAILGAAKTRAQECQLPESTLDSTGGRMSFLRQLGQYPAPRSKCVSPWFFWKSLKNP